ncbi:unnamed protein product [Cyprideis torosa]|uniref:tRNA-dihydrouridine(47) synthase [NAD(P)(+)] n=1 Tax=Cyprideis torosa TaxID=163714 RepID=A0A7R8WGZ7_9CRUS|nr:unnamed protein product [Cyprideis torosa]CAG0893210.1 unnamed protein product [Cyprideis torosa]
MKFESSVVDVLKPFVCLCSLLPRSEAIFACERSCCRPTLNNMSAETGTATVPAAEAPIVAAVDAPMNSAAEPVTNPVEDTLTIPAVDAPLNSAAESPHTLPAANTSTNAAAPGDVAIKPEFLMKNHVRILASEFVSEKDKQNAVELDEEPPTKSPRLEPSSSKMKKLSRGRNKKRPVPVEPNRGFQLRLCGALKVGKPCEFKDCRYGIHDVARYLSEKPPDIGPSCYVYETFGFCRCGFECRFGDSHIDRAEPKLLTKDVEGAIPEKIVGSMETLQSLRKKLYDFKQADEISRKYNSEGRTGPVLDTEEIRLRESEKRKIDWKGKLYCAPLTTVGNLPFRRIVKRFGADVTCGEMALATSLLQGKKEEWCLLRRHASEDLFGVQVCGFNAGTLSRVAQAIRDQVDCDFVDLNCGCPIDMIFQRGGGSGMMRRRGVLEAVGRSMSEILKVPLTVKMRMGIERDKNIAHSLIPDLKSWGYSMITVHGRSRQQRYTKLADWSYIEECARVADPLPLFGNGDVLSWEDAQAHASGSGNGVAGVMVARGALIKPWIFTEIKEQRHWDISSTERLSMLQDFTNFGLEHWGSDFAGVERTRRFMLEWLSFLYRYVPVGLLERVPQRMNERPPLFKGRDDLETMMASPHCGDWIKITELLLGKVPDGFRFLPKHKANAWG